MFVSCFGAWLGHQPLPTPCHHFYSINIFFRSPPRFLAFFGHRRLCSPAYLPAAPHWQLVVFARNIYYHNFIFIYVPQVGSFLTNHPWSVGENMAVHIPHFSSPPNFLIISY